MTPGSWRAVAGKTSGSSACRARPQPAMLPCGSVSTSATGPLPVRSACTARWPASVVLPAPPFCEVSATTCNPLPDRCPVRS